MDLSKCQKSSHILHSFLLGVCRKVLLTLWFDSTYHNEAWSIREYLPLINDRLLKIKPPCYVRRTPRSLEHRAYWKASECFYWLLFYSPIVLKDILPSKFYQHHLLLVHATHILYSESISQSTLSTIKQSLKCYAMEMEVNMTPISLNTLTCQITPPSI